MNDLITKTIDAAAKASSNTFKSEMSVVLDARAAVADVINAWGAALGNSRGAPNWARIDPIIEDINKERAVLTVVTDQASAGALAFEFGAAQLSFFEEIKEMMVELAERIGSDAPSIEAAKTAFDAALANAQISEAFDAAMGSVAVGAYLEKTAEIHPVVFHERFGELNNTSLMSLSKMLASPLNPDDPNSDDAIAAQLPREMAAPDSANYQYMGQMITAGDAPALKKHIADYKEKGKWTNERSEGCDKLVLVAAAKGDLETVKVLVQDGGAEIDYGDRAGMTPLLVSVAGNQPELIAYLFSQGASRASTTKDDMSLLMLAASYDAVDSIRKLHELKFNLDERSLDGRTALHHAACGQEDATSVNAIKLLIELGANPTIADESDTLAEELIDENNDEAYALLTQRRKDWENGKTGPQSTASSLISSARAKLGF